MVTNMGKKVAITGGTGFVGINLALHLVERGYRILLVDFSDRMNRVSQVVENMDIELETMDVDLARDAFSLPEDVSAVIHLAAWPHVDFSYYYPQETLSNNVLSLTNVLNSVIGRDIPVILASSVEIYGGIEDKIYEETDMPNPVSPYGASKIACELVLNTYRRCYNLKAITFRLTNLYGPWQLPDRVVPRSAARLLSGGKLDIEADVVRDFVYIDDAVRAITMIMESGRWGEIYNISSGKGIAMSKIADSLLKLSGNDGNVVFLKSQVDQQRGKSLIIGNSKIVGHLGWEPRITFEEGIKSTFDWYARNEAWWSRFRECFMADRNSQGFVIDCVYKKTLCKEV